MGTNEVRLLRCHYMISEEQCEKNSGSGFVVSRPTLGHSEQRRPIWTDPSTKHTEDTKKRPKGGCSSASLVFFSCLPCVSWIVQPNSSHASSRKPLPNAVNTPQAVATAITFGFACTSSSEYASSAQACGVMRLICYISSRHQLARASGSRSRRPAPAPAACRTWPPAFRCGPRSATSMARPIAASDVAATTGSNQPAAAVPSSCRTPDSCQQQEQPPA